MLRLIRALFDGFILRCPNCHKGHMFAKGFTINHYCPVCNIPFERSTGEITGGMGINIVATLLVIVVCSLVFGRDVSIPLLPLFAGLAAFAILFPIVFYRSSRGIWVGWLYIIGNNNEQD